VSFCSEQQRRPDTKPLDLSLVGTTSFRKFDTDWAIADSSMVIPFRKALQKTTPVTLLTEYAIYIDVDVPENGIRCGPEVRGGALAETITARLKERNRTANEFQKRRLGIM
jgi:hypothetical protein